MPGLPACHSHSPCGIVLLHLLVEQGEAHQHGDERSTSTSHGTHPCSSRSLDGYDVFGSLGQHEEEVDVDGDKHKDRHHLQVSTQQEAAGYTQQPVGEWKCMVLKYMFKLQLECGM